MNGAGGRGTFPRCSSGSRRVAAPWSSAPPLFPPRSPAAAPPPCPGSRSEGASPERRSSETSPSRPGRSDGSWSRSAGELSAVLRCPRRVPVCGKRRWAPPASPEPVRQGLSPPALEPGPEPSAQGCRMHPLWRMDHFFIYINAALLFYFSYTSLFLVEADSPSAPVNVTVKHLKANSAVVTWDVLEDEVVIGFAISQQKKDVRMLRFIQEVNTTTRSCALWDLEEDTEYIVHVQSISIQGQSPASEPVLFKTPREAEKLASKNKDEVTMKEMGKNQQLRAGEILIIVVVLFMWAGVIALFCRQYDIIKDNEPNNNKEKAKSASESSTPEHQSGGLLRSKFPKNKPSVNIIEA
ncbi:fibronectin type III domain-containing protein 5 isoform X1 [Lepidochelys kempii]|uniref:fibronectin type III domain-containing protein 5 isoform X1 n=2 Tax=Cheloniidae TaxID=8465 RepID=UPI003C70184F